MLATETTLRDKVQPLSLRGPRHTDERHRRVGIMRAWGAGGWGRRNL